MKVLLTTPYKIWPANYGGAVRTVEIAAALENLGHDTAILSAEHPLPNQYAFKSYCSLDYFFNPSFVRKLKSIILDFNPDLILSAFPYQSGMLVPVARKFDIPLIYDAHNIESLRFGRLNKQFLAKIVSFFEGRMIKNSIRVICVSREEEEFVNTNFETPTLLIPNGVNVAEACPESCREFMFCFFGALDYGPNIAALEHLRKMWPEIKRNRPDATLLLVGRNPPAWSKKLQDWLVLGEVDSIPRTISRARILLCPITEGGGSRLKIVEAVASGLIVVATRFGAEGFESLIDKGSIRIFNIEDFASQAVSISQSMIDHQAIAQSAIPYDWKSLVAKLDLLDLVTRTEQIS